MCNKTAFSNALAWVVRIFVKKHIKNQWYSSPNTDSILWNSLPHWYHILSVNLLRCHITVTKHFFPEFSWDDSCSNLVPLQNNSQLKSKVSCKSVHKPNIVKKKKNSSSHTSPLLKSEVGLGVLDLRLKLTSTLRQISKNPSSTMKHLQKLNGSILPYITFEDPKYKSIIYNWNIQKNANLYYNQCHTISRRIPWKV